MARRDRLVRDSARATSKTHRLATEGGAALLTVLVATMIIFIMLFEFQYGAMVERQLAYNDLNQLQAYYLAKAGVRIGLLRIAIYGRTRYAISQQSGGNNAQLSGISPYLELIWNLPLPAFPPDAASMNQMSKADKDASEKTAQETKAKEGKVTHIISSESSKINLNYLQVPDNILQQGTQPLPSPGTNPQSLFQYVGVSLVNLINNFIRDSDNPYEEYGNINPENIVYNIMDWVSPGPSSVSGGNKDTYYEAQNPPYKAKRNRFYTIDELRLVKGIDEHLYNKLKPYITVYSYNGKINLNEATSTIYRAIFPLFTDYDLKLIQEQKAQLGQWSSAQQFVDFVSNTLGRPQFKTMYSDPNNYPFDVISQSFLIESSGVVAKSKSQVQKVIRVSVALSSGRGGQVNPTLTNPAQCTATPGMFWDVRIPVCRSKPRNMSDCIGIAGQPQQMGNQACCAINQMQPVCMTPNDVKATSIPNAIKILTWTES